MNLVKLLVFLLFLASFAVPSGCSESSHEKEPLKVKLVIPDDVSGFFGIWPSRGGNVEFSEGQNVEIVVQGERTIHPLAVALYEWHNVSAFRLSGKPIPVHGEEGFVASGRFLISVSTGEDGRNLFLIGDIDERNWYYQNGGALLSVEELNEGLSKRRSGASRSP